MPRRKTTIEAVLDVKQAEAALKSLGRTSIPLNANVGRGGGGGGGGSVMSGDRSWRSGFGAQQAFQSGPFASYGVGGFVTNTAMFAAAGALSRVITQMPEFVANIERLNVSMQRTAKTGEIMAGSSEEFESLTTVYQAAMRGYVTEGEAASNVTSLLALGFADSTQEMMRFVQAGRAAQLSTGRTAESIEQNLILALANADQSVGRIDQLGISMTELNQVVAALREENDQLTLGEARREGIMRILNGRYEDLAASGELAASGLESLGTAVRELGEALASGEVGKNLEQMFTALASAYGSPSVGTIARGADVGNVARRYAWGDRDSWSDPDAQDKIAAQIEQLTRVLAEAELAGLKAGSEEGAALAELAALTAENLYYRRNDLDVAEQDVQIVANLLATFRSDLEEAQAAVEGAKEPPATPDLDSAFTKAVSGIYGLSESALSAGADIEKAYQSHRIAVTELERAYLVLQENVQKGYMTEEEARLRYSQIVESEGLSVQSALQMLSSSAMQAAGILGGLESSILSGMVGSASQALALGGDPQEVLSLLQRQELLASEGQAQLDEMIKNGEDSVAVASFMAAQFQASIQTDMKAYQDQLREAQKVSKGVDRTNEILSHQRNIWENFMDKFSQIEGLMNPSAVTQGQMDMASKGLYKDMPDEWLRRLKDEVFNSVDWENIDPASIFEQAGLGGMDWENAYNQIEGMYESKELFSFFDPNEIFGPEAVQAIRDGLDRMERTLAGEKRFQSFLASVFGDQEEIQAGLTLGIVDPATHAWDQALQGMTDQARESDTGPAFVNAVVAAIEDGTIRAALLNQLTVSEEELAAGIGGSVETYDNQSAEANVTP